MTWLEIILSLALLGQFCCLAFVLVKSVGAVESIAREPLIALAYIRDKAAFYTVDDFARAFLAGGWTAAAAEAFPDFDKFRKEWITAGAGDDA